MDELKPFRVTDLAGTHVAGHRIQDRIKPLMLTEAQAAYELQLRTVEPWPDGLKFGEAIGVEMHGIPAVADGIMREAPLGDPDGPEAPLALPADADAPVLPPPPAERAEHRKPRSKAR